MRGKLYRGCVQCCILHGSETWPAKKENEVELQWAEMKMTRTRWTCCIKLTEMITCSKLRD